ncbi:MAG: hypothetical protein N2Z22_06245 [Turneriella sp.]|nr:hypothetical protein [Turneriella sp.]
MASAFSRVVFFQASAFHRQAISALSSLFSHLQAQHLLFIDRLTELSRLDATDLVICCSAPFAACARAAREAGLCYLTNWERFLALAPALSKLQTNAPFGEVLLAFLKPRPAGQMAALFRIFGFRTIIVDSLPNLERELRNGAALVVLDQDLPLLAHRATELRRKVLALLRHQRKLHRHLAVIILKDFSQGSLFDDVVSEAKEVSNALLSQEEFFEFIGNYLCDLHVAHAVWKLKEGNAFGLVQTNLSGRPSLQMALKDLKTSFCRMQEKSYRDYTTVRKQMVEESFLLRLRVAVTDWLWVSTSWEEPRLAVSFHHSGPKAASQEIPLVS